MPVVNLCAWVDHLDNGIIILGEFWSAVVETDLGQLERNLCFWRVVS